MTKLKTSSIDTESKVDDWQSLGWQQPKHKKEKQKNMQTKHSTSHLVSATWKQQKRIINPRTPTAMNFLVNTTKTTLKENLSNRPVLVEEEDEAMDSQVEDINEGIETSDMKEVIINHEMLFLDRAPHKDGELHKTTIQPNTNHHTNQTTPPTPNNINDKLQYPNRRHSARGPITTFSQELAVDHQTSMALIRDTRWLSDTTIKKTSALEIASYQIRPDEQLAVDEAVTKFVQAGIIEVSPIQNTDYLSNFFTIQEATKRRPILDCQKINNYI